MDKPNSTTGQGVTYISIDHHRAGQRIDNFLAGYLKNVPKSHIYRILRKGEVRVNKGRIKQTYRLKDGDTVRLPPLHTALQLKPGSKVGNNIGHHGQKLLTLNDNIVHQDKDLLVINKPSGLAVHGGSGIRLGLIEQLRALHPRQPYLELVHRLDRDTSGCLMIAKKSSVLREIQQLLREGRIDKRYLLLVQGHWPRRLQEVDVPLKKNTLRSGERHVQVNSDGKAARTLFKVLQYFVGATLLEARLLTGRTHQIRVHATHAGHPLAGDEKYGDNDFNREIRAYGLKRLFLHAYALKIPRLHEPVFKIELALPEDLRKVIENLAKIQSNHEI